MTKFNRYFVSFLFTSLLTVYTPMTQADMYQQSYGNMVDTPVIQADEPQHQTSYGSKVGQKATRAFANLGTAWLEIPKNMINVTNQSNIFYGAVGGLFKGLVNTAGRLGVGVADLITIPLPTKPIAYPVYIWNNFDIDTSYGSVFRLDQTGKTDQPVTQTPVITRPVPTAVATPPRPAVVDHSDLYNQDTNRKLDTFFKKEMQK